MRCSKKSQQVYFIFYKFKGTLETSMAVILRCPWNFPWPMEISRSWKFQGPWKFSWPMENSMAHENFHGRPYFTLDGQCHVTDAGRQMTF